jgi:phosphatidylinositol-3-phosphatase
VRPGVYSARYDHYSLARTLEDAFGVSHLAHARHAHAIAGVWR